MNYFENNYVLSALAGLAVTIFVYIDRKRNASVNKEPVNFLSYVKIFFAVFSITLGILFYKTKNFTLPIPSKMGGSLEVEHSNHQLTLYSNENTRSNTTSSTTCWNGFIFY